jgi:hypothetical protein
MKGVEEVSERRDERYPKTVCGGWRFYREQIAPVKRADRQVAKEKVK